MDSQKFENRSAIKIEIYEYGYVYSAYI